MRPVFDTGRSYAYADIDPAIFTALIEGGTALATTGIAVGAAAAAAKREKTSKEAAAKKNKKAAAAAAAAAPATVVSAPAPSSAVPGWAIGLGAVAVVGVVGLILFMPKKSAPVRTP
jgi:uncharacterized membrane protein YgdD (TMEM256/DUF423 family)